MLSINHIKPNQIKSNEGKNRARERERFGRKGRERDGGKVEREERKEHGDRERERESEGEREKREKRYEGEKDIVES